MGKLKSDLIAYRKLKDSKLKPNNLILKKRLKLHSRKINEISIGINDNNVYSQIKLIEARMKKMKDEIYFHEI